MRITYIELMQKKHKTLKELIVYHLMDGNRESERLAIGAINTCKSLGLLSNESVEYLEDFVYELMNNYDENFVKGYEYMGCHDLGHVNDYV